MKRNFCVLLLSTITSFASAALPPEAVPGEYIVQLKEGNDLAAFRSDFESSQQIHSQRELEFKQIPSMNMLVLKFPKQESPEEVITKLESDPRVEFAEPNYIYHSFRYPNDPAFGEQWNLNNTNHPNVDIGLTKAWDLQTGSQKVVVGIIDTGINYNHPSLRGNMWVNEAERNGRPHVDDDGNGYIDDIHGFDFVNNTGNPMDDQGHGSHCAGIIGAKGNDGIDITGVNWNVRMMALKFLDANGSGATDNAIRAIDYAIKMKARILNNSWGGGPYSRALNQAIARANAAGILFVAAAGNDGVNIDLRPSYPASYLQSNIVTVASIGPTGARSSFSNFGSLVHLAAPGERILSTVLHRGTERLSGTSMAAPHVSGVAALLLAQNPKMKASELKTRLILSSMKLGNLIGVTKFGLVNAFNALKNVPRSTEESSETQESTTDKRNN